MLTKDTLDLQLYVLSAKYTIIIHISLYCIVNEAGLYVKPSIRLYGSNECNSGVT